MKLHLGCGTIYLAGYVNIDGKADFLAGDCPPKILEAATTTFENYYRYEFGQAPKEVVADLEMNLLEPFPFPDASVDEVVMEQVLEHLPSYKNDPVLDEIFRVLRPGGSFVVGVPDVKKTAGLLATAETDEDEDWAIRLIHGTQRNEYSHHYCGFIPRTLKSLLRKHGFARFEDMPVIHFYPVIRIRAYKGN